MARRFVASEDDARDLAQDAIEIALARGFSDWTSPLRRSWLHGVLRRRAAFVARSDGRRRRRELAVTDAASESRLAWRWSPEFLASLPPSLRAVATLASADLGAAEIRWLLQLEPGTLRARLAALKRAVQTQGDAAQLPAAPPQAPWGAARAHVLTDVKRLPGQALATHDPDGHTILLRVRPNKPAALGNR